MTPQPPKPESKWSAIRRRWVICAAAAVVVLMIACASVAIGFPSAWSRLLRFGKSPPTPFLAEINRRADNAPVVKYETRDVATIIVLQSMFVEAIQHRVSSRRPAHVDYTTTFYSLGSNSHDIRFDVWQDRDEHLWTNGGSVYRVFGNFELFVQSLPARRAVQLITSPNRQDRESGRKIKQSQYDAILDVLLKAVQSENPAIQSTALHDLRMFVSECRLPFLAINWTLNRDDLEAVSISRVDEICHVAFDILQAEMKTPDLQDARSAGRIIEVCHVLSEVHHQPTADELAKLLANRNDFFSINVILECLESMYGLPPTYDRGGMCGNSSAEEIERFTAVETKRAVAARESFLDWHRLHAHEDRAAQLTAVVNQWNDRMLRLGTPQSYVNSYRGLPHQEFWDLLRLGKDLVPVLDERQKSTENLAERGIYEFFKAYFKANCDPELVDQLIAGEMRHQILACHIIAVSGRSDWNKQLIQFLETPLPSPGSSTVAIPDVYALRAAATEALLYADGATAFPYIEQAHRGGFENQQAALAIQYFAMPSQ